MSHQSEQEELERVAAYLVLEADRAYEAICRASEYSERMDYELVDARAKLRHHVAAGDQS